MLAIFNEASGSLRITFGAAGGFLVFAMVADILKKGLSTARAGTQLPSVDRHSASRDFALDHSRPGDRSDNLYVVRRDKCPKCRCRYTRSNLQFAGIAKRLGPKRGCLPLTEALLVAARLSAALATYHNAELYITWTGSRYRLHVVMSPMRTKVATSTVAGQAHAHFAIRAAKSGEAGLTSPHMSSFCTRERQSSNRLC
jgi:hypothetical protein